MAGNVNRRTHRAIDEVGAAARNVVHHPVDGFFIPRDDARAQRDGVAGLQRQMLVIIDGHTRERGHGLALRAGDNDSDLVGRDLHDVLRAKQDGVRNGQQA